MTIAAAADNTQIISYAPRGASREVFAAREPEVVLSGPAGTGKSRSILEKLRVVAAKYPGVRILIVRKTLQSLKSSTLITFDEKVQPQRDGMVFHGDTAKRPAHYEDTVSGGVIVIGGMDRSTKILSSEYDIIYVPECTELTESEWETLSTRLRNGKMPYQQLIGDCNPDAPTHWLRLRIDAGKTRELLSIHEDNPLLFAADGVTQTSEGARYLAVLDSLTGVRYLRYRKGIWASAEGMVYEDSWSRAANLIDRSSICKRLDLYGDCGIPTTWPRYLTIDFGFTHPFVCQWWAEDGDGRLYRYREIYTTHRLVQDMAQIIAEKSGWGKSNGDPLPYAIITDHDAEDRATLERHLGINTLAARKSVSDGIQAVAARLRKAGDDKPRLFLLRDSRCHPADSYLLDRKLPTCTEEEVESYIWRMGHVGAANPIKDEPVKENDHGMDALRYMVAHRDLAGTEVDVVDISAWVH